MGPPRTSRRAGTCLAATTPSIPPSPPSVFAERLALLRACGRRRHRVSQRRGPGGGGALEQET
eukprot:10003190-Lingulodinium_polyedra.AAC.1